MLIAGAALSVFIGGCGGGGGACQLSDCGTAQSTPQNTDAYVLTFEAQRSANATPYNQINDALIFGDGGVKVTLTLKSQAGVVQPGVVVTTKVSDTALATLSTSGAVLTDSKGQASVIVNSASPSASGAVTLNVEATIANGSSAYTAVGQLPFRINEKIITTKPGTPAYLKYVSATPTRIFVSGGSAGASNAAEESVVTFKVLDSTNAAVPGATVVFGVTQWTGGIVLKKDRSDPGVTGQPVSVVANADGVASITVRSGTEPLSVNVTAYATYDGGRTEPTQLSEDQIIISGKKPDQMKFFMLWDPSATCGKSAERVYPCKFTVFVGDEKGDPVADGTVVNLVSDTGLVVASKQAGQPSGACLTVNSACSGDYTGKDLTRGKHHVIAYSVGNYTASPAAATKGYTSKPVTFDGSWVNVGGFVAAGGNVIIDSPESDTYVRNCLRDAPADADNPVSNTCMPVN
ncbi:Ig-like domain-containing protein [Niveibacterium microcysteis]|uniref:Ig-like domain-containing protein n=1 Tax=Niveibacterium microcysteis TaxID=2811415 RepID=A0ABX7M4V5_9RHOO|nr:Ig-like domain-containing protein [Niveibacterium microcysteis]QSI76770.1 Ig-like domain-containing protein [Niveibacterium microcysteis]